MPTDTDTGYKEPPIPAPSEQPEQPEPELVISVVLTPIQLQFLIELLRLTELPLQTAVAKRVAAEVQETLENSAAGLVN